MEKGEQWEFHRLVRLPDHDRISFSTNPYSSSGIRVKHHAVVEIKYLLDGAARENTLTMGMRVSVASVSGRRPEVLCWSTPLLVIAVSMSSRRSPPSTLLRRAAQPFSDDR